MDSEAITKALLNFENIRSFQAHWKSKEIVLRFDNRQEMLQFIGFLEFYYATVEDMIEEEI